MTFPHAFSVAGVFLPAVVTGWFFTARPAPIAPVAPTAPPPALVANNVSIVRDTFGVPHVYATTDTSALYGLGYAQAADRLFQMYYERTAYQGRLAEYFGKGDVIPNSGGLFSNIEHDRAATIIGWDRHAQTVAAQLDAATLLLLNAYCDGVNAYVASSGAVINPLFASSGIPLTNWTPADCIGVWYRLGRFFSNLGFEEGAQRARVDAMQALGWSEAQISAYLAGNTVCDDTALVIDQSDVPTNTQNQMAAFALASGVRSDVECLGGVVFTFSQAMVAKGSKVSTGEALMLSEPRLPVFLPNTLYEASVQGATFTVRGACLPGTANFLVGSTPLQTWGVTALGIDQGDLFRLVTDAALHPGQYFLDGAWRPFDLNTTDTLVVKNDPALNEVLTVRETFFGPVVTELVDDCNSEPAIGVGPGCTAGFEYSSRAVPFALPSQDSFQGYMAMYRAANPVQFMRATEHLIWPSMNLVMAASDGQIGYIANGACPVRKANEFLAGFMALDGDATANDWPTYVPHGLKPWVLNPAADFLVTANHRPIGSWYPLASLYPATGDTLRSWRLREAITNTASFTPTAFRDLHLDRVNPGTRELAPLGKYLRDVQLYPLSANAQAALRALIPWHAAGGRMDATHGGVAVAHFLRSTLRSDWAPVSVTAAYGQGESGMSLFLRATMKKINTVPPVNLTNDEAYTINFMLNEAQTKLPASIVGSLTAMKQWYIDTQLTGSTSGTTGLPLVYGQQQEGGMAWNSGLTVGFGPLIATNGGTNFSQKGDSFTQFVRPSLTDSAESILPPGISEHSAAPEFTNQKTLWEAGQLKPAPWTLAGVQAMGPTQTVTLRYP